MSMFVVKYIVIQIYGLDYKLSVHLTLDMCVCLHVQVLLSLLQCGLPASTGDDLLTVTSHLMTLTFTSLELEVTAKLAPLVSCINVPQFVDDVVHVLYMH